MEDKTVTRGEQKLSLPKINCGTKLMPRKTSHPYQWYSWKYDNHVLKTSAKDNGENSSRNDTGGIGGVRNTRGVNVQRELLRDEGLTNSPGTAKSYQRWVKQKKVVNSDIKSFEFWGDLHKQQTIVHNKLPSIQVIDRERQIIEMDAQRRNNPHAVTYKDVYDSMKNKLG